MLYKYRVNSLFIYPVKSLPGIEDNEAFSETEGFRNDYRRMLTDQSGLFPAGGRIPEMPLIKWYKPLGKPWTQNSVASHVELTKASSSAKAERDGGLKTAFHSDGISVSTPRHKMNVRFNPPERKVDSIENRPGQEISIHAKQLF
jgi:hypothetical protein